MIEQGIDWTPARRTMHVYCCGIYVGNIVYGRGIPQFTEEELLDEVLGVFPHFKGKKFNVI